MTLEVPIEDPEDPLLVHIVGLSITFEPWKKEDGDKKDKKKRKEVGSSPAGGEVSTPPAPPPSGPAGQVR